MRPLPRPLIESTTMSRLAGSPDHRSFDAPPRSGVRAFYERNHTGQTLDFMLATKAEYLPLSHASTSVWQR